MCEETFIFKTKKEAEAGFRLLERELGIIDGWWYSKKSFSKLVAEEKDHKPANVYWL